MDTYCSQKLKIFIGQIETIFKYPWTLFIYSSITIMYVILYILFFHTTQAGLPTRVSQWWGGVPFITSGVVIVCGVIYLVCLLVGYDSFFEIDLLLAFCSDFTVSRYAYVSKRRFCAIHIWFSFNYRNCMIWLLMFDGFGNILN